MDLKDRLDELAGLKAKPFVDADELLKQIETWEQRWEMSFGDSLRQ